MYLILRALKFEKDDQSNYHVLMAFVGPAQAKGKIRSILLEVRSSSRRSNRERRWKEVREGVRQRGGNERRVFGRLCLSRFTQP